MVFRGRTNYPIQLLELFSSGSLSAQVNGRPLAKIDAETRSLDLDVVGIKETGLKLTDLAKSEDSGYFGLLKTSKQTAKELAEIGWKLSLYDRGSSVLSMGSGVSKLTGHVWVNPFKLRSILKTL